MSGRKNGGGDVVCFNCNKVGHIKTDCPEGDRKTGRRGQAGWNGDSKTCYNCNKRGHRARDCPQGQRKDR